MLGRHIPTRLRPLAIGMLVAVPFVCLAAAYGTAYVRLLAARAARRDDACGVAEARLAKCWRLPGLAAAVDLEEQLLGVQQGDLRSEKKWRARAGLDAAEGGLIQEALAKGTLATFQRTAAAEQADAIVGRQQANAQVLGVRGRARSQMQQEDDALRDLERAVELDPDSFELRFSLAQLLHESGHVHDALSHYRRLRQARPDDERVVLAMAHGLQEEGRLDDARDAVDAWLAGHPDSVAALVEGARVAIRRNDREAAERSLRRAVGLQPDHAEANAALQRLLRAAEAGDAELDERIGRNGRRQADLTRRLLAGQPDAALLTEVGLWKARTGLAGEAAGWFHSALLHDPRFQPAHAALADWFAGAGQPRRARTHAELAGDPAPPSRIAAAPDGFRTTPGAASDGQPALLPDDGEAAAADVHRLCSACHAYPAPETMPRSAWRKEVKQGYDLLRAAALTETAPPLESVVRFYERRAPERLAAIELPASRSPPVRFERRGIGLPAGGQPRPAVTHVAVDPPFGGACAELLLCDSRLNAVLALEPCAATPVGNVIAGVPAPCHTAACDMDGDGRRDLIVAALGSFFPTDDDVGEVFLLRGLADGRFETHRILAGVGRVADARTGDFNGDGKTDVIVAAFGWRNTGSIVLLENRTTDWSQPRFVPQVVDPRHGAIHVPVADIDGDGRPDFVALVGQEHEKVVAFLNDGGGTFRQETIFTAPHPAFSCSGIRLVDLDGDRDLDVLLTNGDVLDRPYLLKPYHGVQWLENRGSYPFSYRLLTPLYGACNAEAADFDGDGDQDVVAVSFLPGPHFPERERLKLPSVAFLEQVATGEFLTHVLEEGACDHFSCAAGDWDRDGDVDFAVGNFSWAASQPIGDAAVLWANAGPRQAD